MHTSPEESREVHTGPEYMPVDENLIGMGAGLWALVFDCSPNWADSLVVNHDVLLKGARLSFSDSFSMPSQGSPGPGSAPDKYSVSNSTLGCVGEQMSK